MLDYQRLFICCVLFASVWGKKPKIAPGEGEPNEADLVKYLDNCLDHFYANRNLGTQELKKKIPLSDWKKMPYVAKTAVLPKFKSLSGGLHNIYTITDDGARFAFDAINCFVKDECDKSLWYGRVDYNKFLNKKLSEMQSKNKTVDFVVYYYSNRNDQQVKDEANKNYAGIAGVEDGRIRLQLAFDYFKRMDSGASTSA